LGQPPGSTLGQGGCGGAGDDAQPPLQWEQAGVARLEVFVEVTPEPDGAEEGGDGIGGAFPSAVAFTVVVQAFRPGRVFEVIEGPVGEVEADVAKEFLEAEFKVPCGGGRDRLCAEVFEETCDLLEVREESFGQGQAGRGEGGCQEEGEQVKVCHGGVLSRGVWAVVINSIVLGKTPLFKQKVVVQLTS
jgi:hypothetical protein